jgi:zinc/manganese transport system ATP-binding protein
MNVIEFKKLSLAYGQRCIFQNFTASINAGEFVTILGANGAGKSTLLRSILGLIPASKGSISLFGQPVHKGAPFIGYMPQMRQNIGNSLSAYAWLGANLNGYQWGLPFLNAGITSWNLRPRKLKNEPYLKTIEIIKIFS